jgi:hypothetical protein
MARLGTLALHAAASAAEKGSFVWSAVFFGERYGDSRRPRTLHAVPPASRGESTLRKATQTDAGAV